MNRIPCPPLHSRRCLLVPLLVATLLLAALPATWGATKDQVAGAVTLLNAAGVVEVTDTLTAGDVVTKVFASHEILDFALNDTVKLALFMDGVRIKDGTYTKTNASTSISQTFDLNYTATAGAHILELRLDPDSELAEANEGNNVVTRNFTVNAKPTITFTATPGTVNEGSTVMLRATAVDGDGTVSKVEFFDGVTKIGEDIGAPYALPVSTLAAGLHNLSAKVTDNRGATATSAAAAVTVSGLATGTTRTWFGGTGTWDFSSNWTPNGIPGATDVVVITAGTPTIDSPASRTVGEVRLSGGTLNVLGTLTTQNLKVTGGTLTGSGTVTVERVFTWSAGTMNGSGVTRLAAGATASVSSGGLSGRTLENLGTVSYTGALSCGAAATINNSGVWLGVCDEKVTEKRRALWGVLFGVAILYPYRYKLPCLLPCKLSVPNATPCSHRSNRSTTCAAVP